MLKPRSKARRAWEAERAARLADPRLAAPGTVPEHHTDSPVVGLDRIHPDFADQVLLGPLPPVKKKKKV